MSNVNLNETAADPIPRYWRLADDLATIGNSARKAQRL